MVKERLKNSQIEFVEHELNDDGALKWAIYIKHAIFHGCYFVYVVVAFDWLD